LTGRVSSEKVSEVYKGRLKRKIYSSFTSLMAIKSAWL